MKKKVDKNQKQITELGRRIAMLRESKDLSQEKLAALAEKSSNCISEIECAKSNPSYSTLVDIARALEIDLYKIIAEAQYEPIIYSETLKNLVLKLKKLDDKELEKISKLIDTLFLQK